jgi:hypothetical protein
MQNKQDYPKWANANIVGFGTNDYGPVYESPYDEAVWEAREDLMGLEEEYDGEEYHTAFAKYSHLFDMQDATKVKVSDGPSIFENIAIFDKFMKDNTIDTSFICKTVPATFLVGNKYFYTTSSEGDNG